MLEPTVAPYGAWQSPVRIDDVVGDVVVLGEPWIDGDDVYWLEGRPAEGGRRVLVRAAADGSTADLTPPPFNVRTRAHEYGGGSYVVGGGIVVFSNFADGRLYRLDPGATEAVPITPAGPWRYADLRPDLARRRFYAVREDHGRRGRPRGGRQHHRRRPARRRRPGGARVRARLRRLAAPVARRHAPVLARVGPPGHALGRDPPARRR